jgi:hypothetical protein
MQGHYVTMDNQIPYSVSQTVNPAVPVALDPGINMLLSETRIANAEIRIGMSKISDNVQRLLDKVNSIICDDHIFLISYKFYI